LSLGFFWPVYSGTLFTVTLVARMKGLRRLVPVLLILGLSGFRVVTTDEADGGRLQIQVEWRGVRLGQFS